MKGKFIIITIALCLLAGFVLADSGVPQTPETQGFITSTNMQAIGTVAEKDNLIWLMTNDGLNGLPGIPPLFPEAASIYSMVYSEDTLADQGLVTYAKGAAIDTQGKVEGTWNVEMEKIVEFVGLDTGRMVSAEEQVLDGAGTPYLTEFVFICPFAKTQSENLPTFCNIVQEGSLVDLTLGSLATRTEERHVTAIAPPPLHAIPGIDFPVSDNGVEADYQVTLTGFGDTAAAGSAEAYINVHVQEGRGIFALSEPEGQQDNFGPAYYGDPKAEDLTYAEHTTAAGDIVLFQKAMEYHSKLTGGGGVLPVT